MAGVILVVLSTGIAGVLTSSISAHTVARERTNAEQCANDQIEMIRRIPNYADVGTTPIGSPPGIVPKTAACANGLAATKTTTIKLINDKGPTSYTGNNYLQITVAVTRDRDGKELAKVVTQLAPEGRPSCPSCGVTINVKVIDIGVQQPYVGAIVNLKNGPSPDRSDLTDSAGLVSFGALDPNPTSGPDAYYDLTVTGVPGYQTLATDVPPGTATPPATGTHMQLAPGETSLESPIKIFKPATINLVLLDAGGNPYTLGAAIKITSSYTNATTSDTVAAGASGKTITSLAGDPVIPGATYTIKGYTTSGLCAMPSPSIVPASGYPGNTTQTFTLQFTACPSGTLAVNVRQLSLGASGATVDITGGPNNISISGGPTDSNGDISFSVPEGSGYTITATKAGQSASATAAVTASATTNVNITLPNPPSGSVAVNVKQSGVNQSGATVTIQGGPWSISITGSTTTDASGNYTFSNNIPAGSGYTVTATKGTYTFTSSSFAVTASATTNVNITLPNPPSGSVAVNVKQLGVNQSGATVTIQGGPWSISITGSTTTDASGNYTFSNNIPAGSGYTVTATKGTYTFTSSSFAVTASATTNVNITLPNPPNGSVAVNVKQLTFNQSGATVTIQGGPWSISITGSTTTDASGNYTFSNNIPAGGGYTVTATKGTYTFTSSSFAVTASATTNVNIALPNPPATTLTVNVKRGATNQVGASVILSWGGAINIGVLGVLTGTTNSSGNAVFTIPSGTPYTIKAYSNPCSATNQKGYKTTTFTVTGATQTLNAVYAGTLLCPVP